MLAFLRLQLMTVFCHGQATSKYFPTWIRWLYCSGQFQSTPEWLRCGSVPFAPSTTPKSRSLLEVRTISCSLVYKITLCQNDLAHVCMTILYHTSLLVRKHEYVLFMNPNHEKWNHHYFSFHFWDRELRNFIPCGLLGFLCKKTPLFYLQKNPEKLSRTLKTVLLSVILNPIGTGRREDFSCAIVSSSARSVQNCSHFSGWLRGAERLIW